MLAWDGLIIPEADQRGGDAAGTGACMHGAGGEAPGLPAGGEAPGLPAGSEAEEIAGGPADKHADGQVGEERMQRGAFDQRIFHGTAPPLYLHEHTVSRGVATSAAR